MQLNIQHFAASGVEMTLTKENIFYKDGTSLKAVKVIAIPQNEEVNFETDYICEVEGWTKTGINGGLYKIYEDNMTESLEFMYRSINGSTNYLGFVDIEITGIVKKYDRINWENKVTPVNKTNLNVMDKAIFDLYENGATSKDIALSESEVTEDTKILFEEGDFDVQQTDFIQTITNENGTALKFLDGTLICYGSRLFKGINVSSTFGSLFTNNVDDLNMGDYPVSFVATPVTIFNLINTKETIGTNGLYWLMPSESTNIPSASKIGCAKVVRPTSATNCNVKISFQAIGRWK